MKKYASNIIKIIAISKGAIANISANIIWLTIKWFPVAILILLRNKIKIIKRIDYKRVPIQLMVNSLTELNIRLRSGSKEPETVKWLKENILENDVFYDIGANIGAYSLIAASLSEKCKVVAIEPSIETYAALVKNIKLNKLENQILPIYGAVSSKTGIEKFTLLNQESGAAEHPGLGKYNIGETYLVPCFELTTLINVFDIDSPTIIKIDVDGAEEMVIKGSLEIIRKCEIKTILIELEEDSLKGKNVINILIDEGYIIYEKHIRGNPKNANFIFKKSK